MLKRHMCNYMLYGIDPVCLPAQYQTSSSDFPDNELCKHLLDGPILTALDRS